MSAYVYGALAGFQIVSGLHQAETIRANAEIQKEIAELNAQYAEIDAWEAKLRGEEEVGRYQNVINQTISTQRVALASQDVDVNFGTAKELQQETKLIGMLNQLDIREQAHATAMGYKTQARQYRLQGQMGLSQARQDAGFTMGAAFLSAAGTGAQAVGASGYGKKGAG